MKDINAKQLLPYLSAFNKGSVVVVGDIMLDHYCYGKVDRISPEAPVPVVQVTHENYKLGGAGNVAQNITSFGAKAHLVGATGDDSNVARLQSLCGQQNIDWFFISEQDRKTTLKSRIICQNQQIVRLDWESSHTVRDDTAENLISQSSQHFDDNSVIVLSDYGKGVVTQHTYSQLMTSALKKKNARILVDPKVRNFEVYKKPYLVTPNRKELFECVGGNVSHETCDILHAGKLFLQKTCADNLLVTLGARGMALFNGLESVHYIPTFAQDVFDVTGAGDTVIAVLSLALSVNTPLLEACLLANFAAGIVVGQIGAAWVTQESLQNVISKAGPMSIDMWNFK